MELSDAEWTAMLRAGVWRTGCYGLRSTFVRLEVPFYGFDHKTHRGALVVNRDVSRSMAAAFDYLYSIRFPIYTVIPVEAFGGWDIRSETANNTSAMNCRKPSEGGGSVIESPHAAGRAIDINPVQNPWRRWGTNEWEPAAGARWAGAEMRTVDHEKDGVLAAGGRVVAWFTLHGYHWGDSNTTDLMHFDTGYPSTYRSGF